MLEVIANEGNPLLYWSIQSHSAGAFYHNDQWDANTPSDPCHPRDQAIFYKPMVSLVNPPITGKPLHMTGMLISLLLQRTDADPGPSMADGFNL